jgi:hypothetical protein
MLCPTYQELQTACELATIAAGLKVNYLSTAGLSQETAEAFEFLHPLFEEALCEQQYCLLCDEPTDCLSVFCDFNRRGARGEQLPAPICIAALCDDCRHDRLPELWELFHSDERYDQQCAQLSAQFN